MVHETNALEPNGSGMRVLIVEDDPVSALLLRKVLEHREFTVDHAENGVEALTNFSEHRHKIIISDWMMPEMDGVSLCREIRKLGGSYVYVVLLSAKGQRADRLQAFEAGVDDFLTKPLDREELFARLKVAQRILGAEDRLQQQTEEISRASEKLKIANSNLIAASRRFEELFSGMPMACFTFDSSGLLHEWNRAAESLFGIQAHEALLNHIWDKLSDMSDGFWCPELIAKVFTGVGVEGREWVFIRGEELRHIVCNIFPLKGPNGEVLGAISANLDITERKVAERQIHDQKIALEEANERLARLAITDGLTGLWNHRRFREDLDRLHVEHEERRAPMSLILLDVDHFKQYNDTFGHPAGDVVLREVAAALMNAARKGESVARYGGEEFAIILEGCDADNAVVAAERFRKAISSRDWPLRDITASFGAATFNDDDIDCGTLIEQADAALYQSKQNGRDCVSHFRFGTAKQVPLKKPA